MMVKARQATPVGEYLTITETAALLKLAVKTVRNKTANGTFIEGVHYFRPPSGQPRFVRSALLAGLEPPVSAPPRPAGRAYEGLAVRRRRA